MRRFLVATVAGVLVAASASSPQDAVPPSARRLVQERYLPGIDRGLRGEEIWGPRIAPRAMIADPDAGRPYARGRVIVRFRPSANASDAARSIGAQQIEHPSWADFDVLTIDPSADPEDAARRLAARDDVEYAQPAYKAIAGFKPNDPLYSMQWNLTAIDMERAWDIQPGATSSVVVAVLDTGVAYRDAIVRYNAGEWLSAGGTRFPALGAVEVPFAAAPDLAAPDRFVAPYDFIWNDDLPLDFDGHGTHVTGTIGQLTNNGLGVAGMAFNVRIMPVKVLADSMWDAIFGSPNRATFDVIARGIRYAADNGANVINMSIVSIGATGPVPVIQTAIRYAVSKGAFVVVCAGNNGAGDNAPNRMADFLSEVDGAVAVAAVAPDLTRASYSTRAAYVELTAPGGDSRVGGAAGGVLQQTVDTSLIDTFIFRPYRTPRVDAFVYTRYQGTSMAAAHVSGFAALLMQQGIRTPAAIEAAMKRFATDLGLPGKDDEYGYGLINPRATLRGLGVTR